MVDDPRQGGGASAQEKISRIISSPSPPAIRSIGMIGTTMISREGGQGEGRFAINSVSCMHREQHTGQV